jgi:hypothetical protein
MAYAKGIEQLANGRPVSSVLVRTAGKQKPKASNGFVRSTRSVSFDEYYRELEKEKRAWFRRLAERDKQEELDRHSHDNQV